MQMGLCSSKRSFDFVSYINDVWNVLDLLFLGLALVAFLLRFSQDTFSVSTLTI